MILRVSWQATCVAMDVLFSLLQNTLNPSNEIRRDAEKKLGEVSGLGELAFDDTRSPYGYLQLSVVPGYLKTLVELAGNPALPIPGKVAASLAMKNAVSRHWHSNDPEKPARFQPDEKEWGAALHYS